MMISGRVIKLGDNVNTDVICPGKYLVITDPLELAKHACEGIDSSLAKRLSGTIIVAGKNFGCGSSREHSPLALKYAGVKGILVESSARIFFRNSINIGLPVLECSGILNSVEEGDLLELNLETGLVTNQSREMTFTASKLPRFLQDILDNGGLIEHLKKKRRQK